VPPSHHRPRVERLAPNTPASIAAINIGDRIVEINDMEMEQCSGIEIFAALGIGTVFFSL
jgi:C-terminal processing protease CtpA/Prc